MHSSSPPDQSRDSFLLRTTAIVGVAAMLSRVLGFVRDMAMAWLLGSSLAADALVMALRLPHVLRRLLGEGALSMSLTADFVHGGHSTTHPHAASLPHISLPLARAVGLRLAFILGIAVLLGEVLARPLALLLAPGQAQDTLLLDSAVPLLRLCLPYAFAAGMAALGMALLHSMGRFVLPALMPALFNITILVFAALAALNIVPATWFPPQTVAPAAWLLALGVCCGGLAQWLAQAVALRCYLPSRQNSPSSWTPPPAGTGQAAWACLLRLPGAVLGAAAPQLAMLGGMIVASWLPQGSVAALYYAERLLELPLSVAGAALGVASLPVLSRLAAEGHHKEFARTASRALRLSLCVTLPATAGLLAVAVPLVQTLFARGAFGADAVQATVVALIGYAPGLPAYGLTRPLLAACQARRQVRLCAVSGLVAIAAAVAGSAGLLLVLPSHWALLAPPLGVSVGLWVQTILLFRVIDAGNHARNDTGEYAENSADAGARLCLHRHSLVQQIAAALGTGLCAWSVTLTPLTPWLQLALAVPAGVGAYTLTLHALGNTELKELLTQRHRPV